MLSIFLQDPPDGPVHCHLQGGKTLFDKAKKVNIFEHIFFLLALRVRSKLKQDINISPFVNYFTLKNPGALSPFLHVNQMKMYT